jgi:hypothetical protein
MVVRIFTKWKERRYLINSQSFSSKDSIKMGLRKDGECKELWKIKGWWEGRKIKGRWKGIYICIFILFYVLKFLKRNYKFSLFMVKFVVGQSKS